MNSAGCFEPGAVSASVPQAFQLTASGQALMYAGPTGALGAIQAPGVTFGAFPIGADSAASTRVMSAFGDAMAVSSHSAHKAAAIAFVDYLAQSGVATPLANAAGDISVAQANSNELPSSMTAFNSYFAAGKTVAYPSWLGAGQLVSISTAVQQVLNGGTGSIASALQGVDRSLKS
jgi:ABC-type glycerol-3-phosphate transport system substrate-binding protein